MIHKTIAGKVVQKIDPDTGNIVSQEFVPDEYTPASWEGDCPEHEDLVFSVAALKPHFPTSMMQPEVDVEKTINEVLENLPEYSISMRCIQWKYDRCHFEFIDDEDDGKHYVVEMNHFIKGYYILKDAVANEKYYFSGLEWSDLGSWDACVVDALVQCAIFGEVIYG